MSSPVATVVSAAAPYDRAKAVKEFDETKVGVKGLVDSGIQTIPPFFVHPPETLAGLKPGPDPESAPEIPTVDLSALGGSRAAVVEQVRRAASTVGFFQVINHGVPEELLRRTLAAVKTFHEQPAEERARVYRREMGKGVSYISNVDLFQSKAASWRDTIQIRLGPTAADWSEIPEVCREEVMEWDKEVTRVAAVLYGLLSEGLGLGAERLTELGLVEGRVMVGHYYPFCPQPDLTVGLNSHADPGALTVLLQDHIGGLQVETQQGWIHVKPQPQALVINIGDFLQVLSNEAYKSAHHRVLANNCNEARVSVAVFLNPSDRERLFGPLPELTSEEKPPLYRNFTFHEFMTRFFKKELDGKSLTNFFRK
ncbi:1-aminocyclopropane-1-carboxylate oxidase homolog 4 [Cajanus cajan]|uniref:1-aminocyclopropane-1-carboxylate oxidase isogeny 4 n=1 Tax=Cajanus cajan TaxID=3821 RepID=A0A151QZX9_CAJCA|nr:1-aminocyclopropane-1-carboxylate oxidase homolog 4 [Cajanus cajan]KYP35836.1 1-aminocyclopropane-1-carboxylate oxidase isogeny 4 [Cajanus cajan]